MNKWINHLHKYLLTARFCSCSMKILGKRQIWKGNSLLPAHPSQTSGGEKTQAHNPNKRLDVGTNGCASIAGWRQDLYQFSKIPNCQLDQGRAGEEHTRNEDHHAAKVVVTVYLLFNSDLRCMKQICDKLEESKDLFLCHTIPAGLWAGNCYPG